MTQPQGTDDQNLALASLLLDTPDPPPGHKPTTAELWDWMHGSLLPQRAVEVESHVARDPDTFEQWRQLRLSESLLQDSALDSPVDDSGDGERDWWQRIRQCLAGLSIQPARGLAVGLTMVMVFVTAGLLRQSPETGLGVTPDFWVDWQSPKHSAATNLVPEQLDHLRLILSGVSDHLRHEQLPLTGPDEQALPLIDCRVADECNTESLILFNLGQRAAAARSLCLSDQSLATDDTLLDTLATLENSQIALLVHKPLRSWIEASSSAARCAAADSVVNRALSGVSP